MEFDKNNNLILKSVNYKINHLEYWQNEIDLTIIKKLNNKKEL